MVFIALNNNSEIIFAHNSSKGKYKCIYCDDKIFFVNKSKDNKIAHFRHKVLCKYSESINNNYEFYTNEFHFKWTRNLVKPEYLYGYWNNKDIADIINKENIRIIVRRQLLKENYYMNDENIIWILDGELRNGIIKQITYENNEIKYYFCSDNLYDLEMISLKHKIYIDYGLNQIIEIIPNNIKFNYCICNIININDFITMYYNGITYNTIKFINENLKIQEYYGYVRMDEYIKGKNEQIYNSINNILNKINNNELDYTNKQLNKITKNRLEGLYDISYHNLYCKKCKTKLNFLTQEQINKIFYEMNDEDFRDIIEIYNYCKICINNVSKCLLCNLPRFYCKESFKYRNYNKGSALYHNICGDIKEKLEIYCDICNTNIIGNTKIWNPLKDIYIFSTNFKLNDINKNELINNFNSQYYECLSHGFYGYRYSTKYIHKTCINFKYFFDFLAFDKHIRMNQIIYDKLKLLNKDTINDLCYINCFLCNKKHFRLNFDKYTFEQYMLYLEKIKIFIIKKDNKVYNYYNINDKKYAYLCYVCKDKITNHDFYNKFFIDNLEKETNNISEKQKNILKNIKQFCN